MKKDIPIPEVKDIYIAIVNEFNDEFKCSDWNAYIINDKETALEMVLIVSKGYDNETQKETSTMRHKLAHLPGKSYAKIELLHDDVLKLTNSFYVTYFENNTLFDKKFDIPKNTVTKSKQKNIPLINKKGILIT